MPTEGLIRVGIEADGGAPPAPPAAPPQAARASRFGAYDGRIAARAGVAGIRNDIREAGVLGDTMSEVHDRLAELEAIHGEAILPVKKIVLEVLVDSLTVVRDTAIAFLDCL